MVHILSVTLLLLGPEALPPLDFLGLTVNMLVELTYCSKS